MKTSSTRFKGSAGTPVNWNNIVVAIIVFGICVGVMFAIGGFGYVLNMEVINAMDPSTVFWYDWFTSLNGALYAFYPSTWWGISLGISGGIAIAFALIGSKVTV